MSHNKLFCSALPVLNVGETDYPKKQFPCSTDTNKNIRKKARKQPKKQQNVLTSDYLSMNGEVLSLKVSESQGRGPLCCLRTVLNNFL